MARCERLGCITMELYRGFDLFRFLRLKTFTSVLCLWVFCCASPGCGKDKNGDVDAAVQDAAADGSETDVDAGVSDGGDPGPDGAVAPVVFCPRLSEPTGETIHVTPEEADDLRSIVMNAEPGATIVLDDGYYDMSGGDNSHRLSFYTDGVTLRSASGEPENVVLDGNYVTGELLSIAASNITIAEITLARAYHHPIHVTGAADRDTENTWIYRVRILDPGQQAIKINPSSQRKYTDRGRIECCYMELTDEGRAEVRDNCYTGGVDAHAAWQWEIRDNTIIGFWCESGLSQHGIHMWRTSRDTLVERNRIIDCARGIGFGLTETYGGTPRSYPDNPYPDLGFLDNIDGIIRNNFVSAASVALFNSSAGFDSGISIAQSPGSQVLHNTVVSLQPPFSSIEWRFSKTNAVILNNLVTHNLMERNNAQATADGNIENAPIDFFVDAESGDLHLDPDTASTAIDSGVYVAPGLCDEDIDGDPRGEFRDVGADEIPVE